MGFVRFRGYLVAPEMDAALRAVEADSGKVIHVTSGYRSDAEQAQLYAEFKAGKRGGPVAKPGYSNHRTGYAVDVTSGSIPTMLQYGPKRGLHQLKGDAPHFDLGAKPAAHPELYGGTTAGQSGTGTVPTNPSAAEPPTGGVEGYINSFIVAPLKKAVVPVALVLLGLVLLVVFVKAQVMPGIASAKGME